MTIIVAAVLTSLVSVSPLLGLEIGAVAPMAEHVMLTPEGGEASIERVAGKRGTLVLFICVHCPWVQKWSARIARIADEAIADGVGVLAANSNDPGRVTQDGPDGMQRQIERYGFAFPYAIDQGSRLARAFDARRTPEAFLFDAAGALVYHGTIDDNAFDEKQVEEHFLRDAVRALAAGNSIEQKKTKALGCTLKLYD